MFSNGVFFFALVLSFSSISAYAQSDPMPPIEGAGAENSDIFFLCKRNKNIRWLRAIHLENGKCRALYSKEGYLQVISSATYFASCEGVLLSVKKNLEEGHFKCAQIPKAHVLELESP